MSFTLGPGLYGLLGPNGAGKSTMMNIITGNLDATSGKVLWNGKNVLRMGREFRRILGSVSYTHLDVYKRQVLFLSPSQLQLLWMKMAVLPILTDS